MFSSVIITATQSKYDFIWGYSDWSASDRLTQCEPGNASDKHDWCSSHPLDQMQQWLWVAFYTINHC